MVYGVNCVCILPAAVLEVFEAVSLFYPLDVFFWGGGVWKWTEDSQSKAGPVFMIVHYIGAGCTTFWVAMHAHLRLLFVCTYGIVIVCEFHHDRVTCELFEYVL